MIRRVLPLLLAIVSLRAAAQGGAPPPPAPAPAPVPAPAPAPAPVAAVSAAPTDSAVTTDSVFLRVQRLAANGQGDEARALVQQEYEAAPTGSPRFVEALYWRAVVAPTAADAERDLRTIVVDYPLSPWAVDALMRLAQLELSRGQTDQAMAHLQRVVTEHGSSGARPRASFWIARVQFEQGHPADACRQLADAGRTAAASDVELKNQIDYWSQRCANVDTSAVAAKGADSAKTAGDPAAAAAAMAGAATTAPAPTPASKSAPPKQEWTVQVGAYNTRSAADALVKSLKGKGYDARVYGEIAPFRVRIGRYPTHAKADSAAQKLNAKKITGFVTEAEPQ